MQRHPSGELATRSMAKTSAVTDGSITLGVAVGSRQFIADQPPSKADAIRPMHERVQLCQDPKTECSLLRESLEDTIPEEQSATAVYDEIGQRSLDPLFPSLTEDSMTQATLSASQSGIGPRERETSQPRLIWEPSSQPSREYVA